MKFDPKKTIFLIDGSSFLYRAYYGLSPLHTPKGVPIQAVYSFCRMIKRLIDKFGPQYLVLVWDSKGKTTRHEVYEQYKATRQAPPSDLFEQKELIIRFADMIGLAQVQQKGIEADDLMYSIAKDWHKKGYNVVFITSDKDMGQALDDGIFMFDTFKDQLFDVKAFEEKMGFPIAKMPFYFSMLGDASDNIPGVRGIGKKGALTLVQQFDSLEDLYENIEDVEKARMRMALTENEKNAFLSRDLFLLQYHKLNLGKKDLAFKASNWPDARSFFEEFNFKTLLKGLPASQGKQLSIDAGLPEPLAKYTFKLVNTTQALQKLCELLQLKKEFALDTETTGVEPLQDDFVGISFCAQEGTAYYVPFGHTGSDADQQLSRDQVLKALKPILEDPKFKKYMHNAKFDMLVLRNAGIKMQGLDFDSLIAAHLLAQEWQRIGLKNLSVFFFDEPMMSFAQVVKEKKLKDFSQVPLDVATRYSGGDSHQTFKLTRLLQKKLKEEKKLQKLYKEVEEPLIAVLLEMEFKGIYVDQELLKSLGVTVSKRLATIEEEIIALVGPEYAKINLNSPRQIEELLFKHLKMPPQKKSAKGTSYSTDQEVLQILSTMHPVPGLIVRYRELFKLKSTYIDALPDYINPNTERAHTTYSQTVAATGRLASLAPNLQNIPVVGEGIKIRQAFQPIEGNLFISADYSQIELRVLAHLSKDKNLVKAFLNGHDIHAETAARLFDVDLDRVSHDQRQIGKRINFSILYGLTPYGLSKDLKIPMKDAKVYIDRYFEQYPGVLAWMENVISFAKEHSYVQTLGGRRRYVSGIYESNRVLYEEARRVAINTVAQGTAAEIMKEGMINLYNELLSKKSDAHILLQIHDELLLTVASDKAKEVEALTKKILEDVVDWKVPLRVTTRMGSNWLEVSK